MILTYEDWLNENVNENVYPDKNGQLSSYDKKNFVEVGRHTMYLGKDLCCILLFGYTKHDWRGTEEWVSLVSCTSYSTNVNNLGNSNGSIINTETWGDEENAKNFATQLYKSLKMK